MTRCSGVIGYTLLSETEPGVWTDEPIEKKYYGDIVRDNRSMREDGRTAQTQVNDSININNNISVVSNSFMLNNMAFMNYISFMGSKWNITSVDIKPPRMILTIGGLYNG